MRPQRQMWIGSTCRPERIRLNKGWIVRLKLKPWRSKVPVPWSKVVIGRRTATEAEVLEGRAILAGWPGEQMDGFVLEFADGDEWIVPAGYPLTIQRMRSPAREREQLIHRHEGAYR